MRYPHILQSNSRSETVHSAVWFDTETTSKQLDPDTIEHHLSFGYLAHRRRIRDLAWSEAQWLRFETVQAFWSYIDLITRPKVKTYCFCHNTSFDLIVLNVFGSLPALGWKLTSAIIEAPPTIIKFSKGNKTLVFLDTLNWWRMSLKEVGASIGLEKLEMPSFLDTKEKWDIYAKRDVEIIMLACLKWFDYLQSNDLGGFAMTLAGQSLRTYRHRFMKAPIFLDDDENALRVSRGAIYGGRNECYQLGEIQGPIYYIDINSMYLSVMQANQFPTKLIAYKKRVNLDDIPEYCSSRLVTARVKISTDSPLYPLRDLNKLLFPIGDFDTWLSSPELLSAYENGHLRHVYEMAIYERGDIFSSYVDYFYNSRRHAMAVGDKVTGELHKKLGNTLWGKYAQHGNRYSEEFWIEDLSVKVWTEINAQTGQIIKFRQFGGLVQTLSGEAEARESHPAIAAHVTAYGRQMIWQIMKEAGRENVIYCDTDGLFTNGQGYHNLRTRINNRCLGSLKTVGKYDNVRIYGLKDYTLGDISKTKGVKSRAMWLAEDTVRQEQWSSLKGAIANGHITSPRTMTVTKVLKRLYEKGVIASDGKVTPLIRDHPGFVEGSDEA